MAIENEVKYLLRPAAFDEALGRGAPFKALEQHYLAEGTRIRSVRIAHEAPQFFFTFKRSSSAGLVEIETSIDARDFDLLKETAAGSIVKRRTSFHIDGILWDVDLFRTPAGEFVLAEAEMPEGMVEPGDLPDFVEAHKVAFLGADPQWSNAALTKDGKLESLATLANAPMVGSSPA